MIRKVGEYEAGLKVSIHLGDTIEKHRDMHVALCIFLIWIVKNMFFSCSKTLFIFWNDLMSSFEYSEYSLFKSLLNSFRCYISKCHECSIGWMIVLCMELSKILISEIGDIARIAT